MGKTKIKTIDDSGPSEGRLPPNRTATKAKSGVVVTATPCETPAQIATEPEAPRNDKNKKSSKPGKPKPRSKKYLEVSIDLDRTKLYPLPEALDMIKKLSYAKFNATLNISINTVQTGLRGVVSLPYVSGKKPRILVFGPSQLQIERVVFGTDSTLAEIEKGHLNFDLIISTSEWMPKLAKVAKILGPKGLMPNPKNGTIVSGEDGIKKAVSSFQSGKTEYKTESKAPVIHLAVGKLNQPTEELAANVKTLLSTIGKTKIKKVFFSPTMGAAVKLDLASI